MIECYERSNKLNHYQLFDVHPMSIEYIGELYPYATDASKYGFLSVGSFSYSRETVEQITDFIDLAELKSRALKSS